MTTPDSLDLGEPTGELADLSDEELDRILAGARAPALDAAFERASDGYLRRLGAEMAGKMPRGQAPERYAAEGGHWVTVRGTHVFIGKGGYVEKGPAHLTGKTHAEAAAHASARTARHAARGRKEAEIRAKLKPADVEAARKAVADLGGGGVGRFGLAKTVPEHELLDRLRKDGVDVGSTGLKGYRLLDRLVFVGELARHRTGGSPFSLPGSSLEPDRVSYSVAKAAGEGGGGPGEEGPAT